MSQQKQEEFEIRQASRRNVHMRLALVGPAGSGKTGSALRIAYGMCKDWSKITVVDTENSADLESDLGAYNVLNLQPPFHPNRMLTAVKFAAASGAEVIILDSLSAEWDGPGGVLEMVDKKANEGRGGSSFTAWKEPSALHNKFIQGLVQRIPAHVIVTMRSKTAYELRTNSKGKQVPHKIGLAPIQREQVDYEFTTVFSMENGGNALASKDRTKLFSLNEDFQVTEQTGELLIHWCNEGEKMATEGTIAYIHELIAHPATPAKMSNRAQALINEGITAAKAAEVIEKMEKARDAAPQQAAQPAASEHQQTSIDSSTQQPEALPV